MFLECYQIYQFSLIRFSSNSGFNLGDFGSSKYCVEFRAVVTLSGFSKMEIR